MYIVEATKNPIKINKVTCSCCGRKPGLSESFSDYKINKNHFYICGKCGDLLYAIKGAKKENDENAESELKAEIERRMKKGGNKDFQTWYNKEF